jgi:hypothetical protein
MLKGTLSERTEKMAIAAITWGSRVAINFIVISSGLWPLGARAHLTASSLLQFRCFVSENWGTKR